MGALFVSVNHGRVETLVLYGLSFYQCFNFQVYVVIDLSFRVQNALCKGYENIMFHLEIPGLFLPCLPVPSTVTEITQSGVKMVSNSRLSAASPSHIHIMSM